MPSKKKIEELESLDDDQLDESIDEEFKEDVCPICLKKFCVCDELDDDDLDVDN
jgi:hypothetical protein